MEIMCAFMSVCGKMRRDSDGFSFTESCACGYITLLGTGGLVTVCVPVLVSIIPTIIPAPVVVLHPVVISIPSPRSVRVGVLSVLYRVLVDGTVPLLSAGQIFAV